LQHRLRDVIAVAGAALEAADERAECGRKIGVIGALVKKIGRRYELANEGGEQDRFAAEREFDVAQVLQEPSDLAQLVGPDPSVPLLEPAGVGLRVGRLELVFDAVADLELRGSARAVDDAGDDVNVEIARVFDGHAAVAERRLVLVDAGAAEDTAQVIHVVFGRPIGDVADEDEEIRVEAAVGGGLDDRLMRPGALRAEAPDTRRVVAPPEE